MTKVHKERGSGGGDKGGGGGGGSKEHFWDVENLSLSYAYGDQEYHDVTTAYENTRTYRGSLAWQHNPKPIAIKPFEGVGFIDALVNIVTRTASTQSPQAFWRGLPQAAHSTEPSRQGSLAAGLLQSGLAAGRTAGDLVKLMWHLGRRDLGIGRGMATPFVATPDVLKAAPSPNPVMAHCSLPLARVRAVAKRGHLSLIPISEPTKPY